MAFVVGTGQSLAVRWANYQEWAKGKNSVLNVPVDGVIECAVDYSQCPHSTGDNGYQAYSAVDCTSTVSSFVLNGLDVGYNWDNIGDDGLPMPNPPKTKFVFYLDSPGTPGLYGDDVYIIRLRSETMRTRHVSISNIQLECPTLPDRSVFVAYGGGAGRESNTCFVRETCTNDSTPMTEGNLTLLQNVQMPTLCGLVGVTITSSGSYSHHKWVDSTLRGHVGVSFMFGSGPTDYQPMGKRFTEYRCTYPQVSMQGWGPETANQGGNVHYVHPNVRVTSDWCRGGSLNGTSEGVAERYLYLNGGAGGYGVDHVIRNLKLEFNCYQGLKLGGGRKKDGTQGTVTVTGGYIKSGWKAITNDDADSRVSGVVFGGGEISGALNDPTSKVGYGLLVEDFIMDLSYATPPDEYRNGATQTMSNGGQATFRRGAVTIGAAVHGFQVSALSKLTLSDIHFNCTASAGAGFGNVLIAANGYLDMRRCTGTGNIRPFYVQRPPASVDGVTPSVFIDQSDFSGNTQAPRITDARALRIKVQRTKLPNLTVTVDVATNRQEIFAWRDRAPVAAASSTLSHTWLYDTYPLSGTGTLQTINGQATSNSNLLHGGTLIVEVVGTPNSTPLITTTDGLTIGSSGNITPDPKRTGPRKIGERIGFRYDSVTGKWLEGATQNGPYDPYMLVSDGPAT